MVDLLLGSAQGLTGAGTQQVSQNTAGVYGSSESGDQFGYQVTLLDNNNDGPRRPDGRRARGEQPRGHDLLAQGTATDVTGTGSLGIGPGTFGVTGKKAEIGRRLGRVG